MTTEQQAKQAIQQALRDFGSGSLPDNVLALFGALGYRSQRVADLAPASPEEFLASLQDPERLNTEKALLSQWRSANLVFQLTGDDIVDVEQGRLPFDASRKVDGAIIQSYLFMAIALRDSHYTRTQLAAITREVNKLFDMPILVVFQHGQTLTLSVIHRRLHKRDESKDVLEKVTLIKDVAFAQPHRAHVEILFDLSLNQLHQRHEFTDFVGLDRAWWQTLDTSELNKRFYREVANWFFWATQRVVFPAPEGVSDPEAHRAQSVIRLITRVIFCWFLREKRLIPEDLFNPKRLPDILADGAELARSDRTTYYKAILHNLFFATLNTEMNKPGRADKPWRRFRGKNEHPGGRDQHYGITNVMRYEGYFQKPEEALGLFETIPFLNGGLFECLDEPKGKDGHARQLIDGFSDRADNPLSVPDHLFFGEPRDVDLNEVYGTKSKRYTARGLVGIFDSYKFTVEENTPIEEEVALDPELLGQVFENLLAAYNPETGVTARKQTGSFYTPREIVSYMVDEALVAYLESKLADPAPGAVDPSRQELNARLRHLLAYTDEPHRFDEAEVKRLIDAVDNLKVLDPACGSGAFPMGVLHKLVLILGKLDPGNERWKDRQIATASQFTDSIVRERAIEDIEQAFSRNDLDYGRKLYLIQNCLYGVDIQPIAVQIAKLRCFIALVVDQRVDDTRPNRGILPLPNLETKFVAANSLLPVEVSGQTRGLRTQAILDLEEDLARVRREHFGARTQATKEKHRKRDEQLRAKLGLLLREAGLSSEASERLAHWNPYDQNASADFFDPEWMFGVAHGFDVTIGNPPYVRADSGEAHLALRKKIMACGQYETLWEKWDLFVPFIELSYKLLKPGGFTTMIVSDAYCHAKYAQKSQTWFLKNGRVCRLDLFSKIRIFDAAVHNMTYLFQKADGLHNRPERRVHYPEFGVVKLLPTGPQRELTYRAFFPEEGETETTNFRRQTIPLESICYISVGMVVHADEAVAHGAFELDDLVAEQRDSVHPKPFVEGKYLARWLPLTNKWLEWGTDRAPRLFRRPTFPALYEVSEKLISVDMAANIPELRVAYDNSRLYHNHSAWSFVPWRSLAGICNNSLKKKARYRTERPLRPDLPRREDLEEISRHFSVKFLLGAMNSNSARDFLLANRRNNIHLFPDDWKKLPIPDAMPEEQGPIVALVDRILAARRVDIGADVSELEAEVDRLVSELYGVVEASDEGE